MSNLTPKRQVNEEKWLSLIRECRSSGLTVIDWCNQNGVSIKGYYYWIAKFRKRALEDLPRMTKHQSLATNIELTEVPLPAKPISEILPADTATPALVRCGNVTIEVNNSASPELIDSIIKAVSRC